MRSGPSALTTRRLTRRQVKRAGGPSGISAKTVRGSGLASRSGGRGGLSAAARSRAGRPAKALRSLCASSGMWLAFGKRRRTARVAQAIGQARRSGSRAAAARSVSVRLVCAGRSGSVTSAASAMRSTPKPMSMVSILSFSSRTRWLGSREGALKPASITAEEPSARAAHRRTRRAPRPARASLRQSSRGEMLEPGHDAVMGDERLGEREAAPRNRARAEGRRASPRGVPSA